ncbi:MAG: hypothetical protein AVDCRST_MAG32-802, partial [uncultured Nocardioides sp.]
VPCTSSGRRDPRRRHEPRLRRHLVQPGRRRLLLGRQAPRRQPL